MVSKSSSAESHPARICPITLDVKHTGKPSAGNLHAGFDEAGAGNQRTIRPVRHSQRKRGATDRLNLRRLAPVLDPTSRNSMVGGKCRVLPQAPEVMVFGLRAPATCYWLLLRLLHFAHYSQRILLVGDLQDSASDSSWKISTCAIVNRFSIFKFCLIGIGRDLLRQSGGDSRGCASLRFALIETSFSDGRVQQNWVDNHGYKSLLPLFGGADLVHHAVHDCRRMG